jgi:hypothetical protein
MARNSLLCSLVVLVATGCTSVSGGSLQTPPATVTAGTTPAANVTASPDAALTLTCSLPVNSPTTPGDPVPGGWISFPGGNFERDPASLPIRLQAHVPSYDRAIKAWLPVEYRYVAPSGSSYILTGDPSVPDASAFYLVDVKTGTRRLVLDGNGPPQAPGSWTVVDFASAGVYLWSAGIQTVPGLWLLDPATGKVRLVDGSHYWRMVANGVAWALDPEPSSGSSQKQGVFRLDIASGQVERWYEADLPVTGTSPISMLAPDSDGHVLIVIGDESPPRLGLLVGPDQFQRLALPPGFPAVSDGYLRNPGVWLALRGGGLALYTARDGVRIMTRQPDIFDVAGGCW